MKKRIDELKKAHGADLMRGLKELFEKRGVHYTAEYGEEPALALEEVNSVWDTEEYESYVRMLEEIEGVNPRLAVKLEEYFLKELNLVALLGFQLGKETDKSVREEVEKLV